MPLVPVAPADEPASVTPPDRQFRIDVPGGTFLVLHASVPTERPRPRSGYVAIWVDYDAGHVSIYDRRLEAVADLGHALYNLAADLDVDLLPTAAEYRVLRRALREAAAQDEDPTRWLPATRRRVLRVMDFDLPDGSARGVGGIGAELCGQPVFDTGDPDADPDEELPPDQFDECCLGCGGGGPPPPDPCDGIDCDDGDPCTDDACVNGACVAP